MKHKYNLKKLLGLVAFFVALSSAFAQAPGGVSADLQVWLKANAGINTTTDGSDVTSWSNFGDSGGAAGQQDNLAFPTYEENAHNFNPAVYDSDTGPNGTLTLTDVFAASGQRNLSTFVTQSQADVGLQSDLVSFGFTPLTSANILDSPLFSTWSTGNELWFHWDGNYGSTTVVGDRINNIPTIDAFYLPELTASGFHTTTFSLNGSTGEITGTANIANEIGNHLHIHGDGGNNNNSGGSISEVIVYESDLTDNEKLRINSYLAIKYGITLLTDDASATASYLNSSSVIVWDTSANTGYNNNVAGIANDGLSALNQKQSKSVNTGEQVLIGTTGLADNNTLNGTSLTDGQFLLWGDNGLEKSLSVTTTGLSGVNTRFAAIWKVQNTGSVGTVRVTWPVGVPDIHLIQSTDETIDGSDTLTDMSGNIVTINGVDYNYADVTLADGSYFTFAGYMGGPGGVAASAWYRADATTTLFSDAGTTPIAEGDNVHQWNEYNATGYDLLQASGGDQPVFSETTTLANFNPTVTFSGSQWLRYTAPTGENVINRATGSLYAAGYVNEVDGNGFFGFDDSMDFPGLHTYTDDHLLFFTFGGPGYQGLSDDPMESTSYFTSGGTWENDGGDAGFLGATVSLDGIRTNYSASEMYNVNLGDAYRDLQLGQDTNFGIGFNGQLNEAAVFENRLSVDDMDRVETYFAIKYGTTFAEGTRDYKASDLTTVWNATDNNGYHYNIAGIAKDDTGALNQKQSWSTNPGQQVLISTTGLADTNADNTTELTDGQYLVWGDNGLEKSISEPISGIANVNFHFASIWKVQNTGGVGSVRVAWPNNLENLTLLQSTDETFDNSDTATPMTNTQTINGVEYAYADVTLTDGQFFTFAGFQYAPGGVTSAAWYRADAVNTLFSDAGTTNVTDAATIQQWNEFNNKPFPLSQDDAGWRPEFSDVTTQVNFNPTVTYTGGEKWLQYDPADSDGYIIDRSSGALFSAGNSTTGSDPFVGFGLSGRTNDMDDPGLYSFTGNEFLFYPRLGEYDPQSTYHPINGPYIGGGTWENGAGTDGNNAVNITLDGFYDTFETGIEDVRLDADRNTLMVGKADAGYQLEGQQNEMIVFNDKLTDQEVNRVESYLAIKYGHTLSKEQNRDYLSSTGTVMWDGTDTGYYNNVFGIARDDISALHQKQSKSINDGQKLIIGAGSSLFDTNAANTSTLTNDGNFLMVGDNGLRQGLATPLTYTGGANGEVNFRFEAIWKAQTNTAQTITVAWPKGISNLYLVQSLDETFDSGDIFTPMTAEVTVNGVVHNTATVNAANGYFTFAGFGNAPGGVSNNLSYWYRADVDAANTGAGTDVTGWTDVWSGTIVTQMGTNAMPKYVEGAVDYFNFNSGIEFTDVEQTLGNITVQTISELEFDIFTLTKEGISPGGNGRVFSSLVDNNLTSGSINYWDGIGLMADDRLERVNNTYGARYLANPGNIDYSTSIPSIMYNTFTDLNLSKGLNGAANGTDGSHSARGLMNGGHAFGNTEFDGNGSDNEGFTGHIGETIIYGAGNLTDEERRRVDSYLAIKYGITLDRVDTNHYLGSTASATSIVWDGSDNPGFNNNIFGIARSDIGNFEQKVSKSVNSGTILTIATDDDFASENLDASRTVLPVDETYFLLGDNDDTNTTLVNVTVNGNNAQRIQRAWLSQRTNTPGVLYFEADLSVYGTDFDAGNNVYMLVADDDSFSTNVITVAGTHTGSEWVFNYNFDSDNALRYITFATTTNVCFTDTDGDGIVDCDDQDDDNDGILDCDEKGLSNDVSDAFELNGSANQIQPNEVQLTPNQTTQSGQMWSYGKIDFTESFTLSFEAYLGDHDGADGVAAVFHNDPNGINATGANGDGIGARGIADGIVLEIDTYGNTIDNSNFSHTQIWDSDNQSPLTGETEFPGIEDDAWHPVVITWNASTETISYTLDGNNAGSYTGDLINNFFGGVSTVYFGYTASTGGETNDQRVRFTDLCDNLPIGIDTDGDGIPDYLDLDSDNDGCVDAAEGDGGLEADLVTAGGTLSVGTGSTAANENLCENDACIDADGIPTIAAGGQGIGSSQDDTTNNCYCTQPGATGTPTEFTKTGISDREGAVNGTWPDNVPNGFIAIQSEDSGFVITRLTSAQINSLNAVEGMLVYDTDEQCIKLYNGTDWNCIERSCNE